MSLEVKAVIWIIIIGTACYALNVNPVHIIGAFFHALGAMHNQSVNGN